MAYETVISIYKLSMWYCLFSMWFIWISHRWFYIPAINLLARVVSLIACVSTVIFTSGTIIDIIFDMRAIISSEPDFHSRLSFSNISYALLSIGFILICLLKFWKAWWHCITHINKTNQE